MQAYLGEIRLFTGNFAPTGWALCNGQSLPIAGNESLFSLIGTTYGGDGQSTFAVPDLRGRIPLHIGTLMGQTLGLGQAGGSETVTLTTNQVPVHTHAPTASAGAGTASTPGGQVWSQSTVNSYATGQSTTVPMSAQAISPAGGGQPHNNMMPYLALNFIICTAGFYPQS